MPRQKIDRLNQRIGKLTVIRNLESSQGPKNRGGLWLCQCDCGKTKTARGNDLGSGSPRSCGCENIERLARMVERNRGYEKTTISIFYSVYRCHCQRNRRKGRNGLHPLTREEWEKLVFQPCAYCGEIDTRNAFQRQTRVYTHLPEVTQEQIDRYDVKMNGIDRVDSSKGYEPDNCVPCCEQCNRMKLDYDLKVFYAHVDKIHHYRKVKQ